MHGNPAPVTTHTARRLCCDADIRRLILDPTGIPIDIGRQTKTVSLPLRIAVTTRDVHCRFPGCREPIDDIHHIHHWADGGPTDAANLAVLCWWHHHETHCGTWNSHRQPQPRTHLHPQSDPQRAQLHQPTQALSNRLVSLARRAGHVISSVSHGGE